MSRRFVFLSMSLAIAAGCGGGSTHAPRPDGGNTADASGPAQPDITGRWVSPCVATGSQNFTLDFDITASAWTLDYATFADAACQTPFLTVRIVGPWALDGPSEVVSGAWEARFGFTGKTVTPHLQAAADFLASEQGCARAGFTVDTATAIYEEGCPGLGQYPSTRCEADYDLVSLSGGQLQFGARPDDNDMCTPAKRPAALSGLALTQP